MARHRVRDAVHDIIEFDTNNPVEAALWDVIQTPAFQRLRRIKQLGFSELVYPGATHSRFSHSIGVFHIARNLISVLKDRLRISDPNFVIVAALLHDIGHGPFSHTFERVYRDLEIPLNHEIITSRILATKDMKDALRRIGDDRLVENVTTFFGSSNISSIGDKLISSQLDADRLDYILRDQAATGTKVGTIDYRWITDNLRRVERDGAPFIALNAKAVSTIELYIANLFFLYSTVYYHKTTRGAESILCKIFVEVFSMIRDGKCASEIGLYSDHPLMRFGCSITSISSFEDPQEVSYLTDFLQLDDVIVMGAVRTLARRSRVKTIRDLASCLLERRLYKAFDVRIIIEEQLRKYCPRLFLRDQSGLKSAAHIYQDMLRSRIEKEVTAASLKIETPIKTVLETENLLQDRDSRSAYRRNSPIWVERPDGELEDMWDISPMVRALGEHNVHRLYYRVPEGDDKRIFRQEKESELKMKIENMIVESHGKSWETLNTTIGEKSKSWLSAAKEVEQISDNGHQSGT